MREAVSILTQVAVFSLVLGGCVSILTILGYGISVAMDAIIARRGK